MSDTPKTDAAKRDIKEYADQWVPRYISEELERELRNAYEALNIRKGYRECPDCKADIADGFSHHDACKHFRAEKAAFEMFKGQ
jgi:hypothetical protein